MADMNNRPAVSPPRSQKSGNVLLGARVITRSFSGVIVRIDGLLDIDD
jgi:hypothetical protein